MQLDNLKPLSSVDVTDKEMEYSSLNLAVHNCFLPISDSQHCEPPAICSIPTLASLQVVIDNHFDFIVDHKHQSTPSATKYI
jgi:hypothetical protein